MKTLPRRKLKNIPINGCDEKDGDSLYFVIEAHPAYAYSGYIKQIAWIDSQMYQPIKIEFYDRKERYLKPYPTLE